MNASHSKTVATNHFKPKIADLSLYKRQDLPIEERIERDSPDCTSSLRPLFSILISDARIMIFHDLFRFQTFVVVVFVLYFDSAFFIYK